MQEAICSVNEFTEWNKEREREKKVHTEVISMKSTKKEGREREREC